MFLYLVLLFTILPAIELAILIKLGVYIGVGNTLFIIILTGIIGAYLARMQGFSVYISIQKNLNVGKMPTEEMIDGVMILIGGIVLLTPGLITDTIGFLLLIPWTRGIIKFWLKKKFQQMVNQGTVISNHSKPDKKPLDFEDADYH